MFVLKHSREDNSRDIVIVEFVVLVFFSTVEPIGEPSSGRDGDWCEESLALDVADREDAFNVRLLPFVDDNVPVGVKLDADILKTKVHCIRLATDCPKDRIDLNGLASVEMNGEGTAALALDLDYMAFPVEIDAGVLHPWQKHVLQ